MPRARARARDRERRPLEPRPGRRARAGDGAARPAARARARRARQPRHPVHAARARDAALGRGSSRCSAPPTRSLRTAAPSSAASTRFARGATRVAGSTAPGSRPSPPALAAGSPGRCGSSSSTTTWPGPRGAPRASSRSSTATRAPRARRRRRRARPRRPHPPEHGGRAALVRGAARTTSRPAARPLDRAGIRPAAPAPARRGERAPRVSLGRHDLEIETRIWRDGALRADRGLPRRSRRRDGCDCREVVSRYEGRCSRFEGEMGIHSPRIAVVALVRSLSAGSCSLPPSAARDAGARPAAGDRLRQRARRPDAHPRSRHHARRAARAPVAQPGHGRRAELVARPGASSRSPPRTRAGQNFDIADRQRERHRPDERHERPSWDEEPAWSPDGKWIAFAQRPRPATSTSSSSTPTARPAAAHLEHVRGHRAVVVARRVEDRLHEPPRRLPAPLGDERRRVRRAPPAQDRLPGRPPGRPTARRSPSSATRTATTTSTPSSADGRRRDAADRRRGSDDGTPTWSPDSTHDRVREQPRRRRGHLRRCRRTAAASTRSSTGVWTDERSRLAPLTARSRRPPLERSEMDERLAELRRRLGEVSDLRSAQALLDWDQMVMMPPAGAAVRAERLATLERVAHERFADDRIGELVDELRELEASLPYDSDDASLIRVTRRDWEKATPDPGRSRRRPDEGRLRGDGGLGRRAGRQRLRRLPALARPASGAEARVDRVLRARRRPVRHPPRRLRAGDDDGRGRGRLRPAAGGARAADRATAPATAATASARARSPRRASARSGSRR